MHPTARNRKRFRTVRTNDHKPQVKVRKELDPADVGGAFDLYVDGVLVYDEAGHNDESAFVNADVGATPAISETAGVTTTLANYNS